LADAIRIATKRGQLAKLVALSKGIPLYLRYVRTPEDVEIIDSALESIELLRWRSLLPLARDIVTYTCLSARPVPLDALIALTGEKDLMNAIEQASVLTLETAEGFSPIHQHLRTTIRAELGRSPARHAYYASALGRQLARTGDYLSAFFVLDAAGLPSARRIVARASFGAAQQGDFRSLTRVLRRRVEFLASAGPSRELFVTVAGLAQAEDNTGDAESARTHWQEAENIAKELGDTALTSQFRAESLIREALATTSPGSLEALATLRAELAAANEKWLAAKIALDLSGIFIRIGREKDAAETAEAAVREFASLGDTYGTELARRNFASALSQVPGREEEAARLAKEFTREDVAGSKRLQAFRCNLLFRAARKRGDNKQAAALASEALAIGEELQDVWVVITNTINLANVRRDEDKLGEAITLYNKVSEMARRSGLRTMEAIASRHAAEVHNQRKEFSLAKSYAEYAVAVLRETAAEVELAIALEERADAERGLGDRLAAAATYLEAAGHLLDPSDKGRKARLLSQAASLYLEANNADRFFEDFGKLYGCATDGKLSVALALLEKVATELPSRGIFGVLNVYFRFLFRSGPPAINRRLFRLTTERIVGVSSRDSHVHLALIPLLAAIPAATLDLQMLVEVADGLHRNVKALSFKSNADLSLNYVAELNLGRQTILSFTQIDDRAETGGITTILALFFLGFQEEISRDILEGTRPERPEVKISVISLAEAKAGNLPVDLEAGRNFAVTRPADFGEEGIPTFVLYRDGLLGTWEKEDYANGLLGLLATVLLEVTFQLLKAEVDSDTLHRNIIRVVANLL
jgi:tetratricopeptide (TPR) repeat protein